jgi:hypothetical protein
VKTDVDSLETVHYVESVIRAALIEIKIYIWLPVSVGEAVKGVYSSRQNKCFSLHGR